MSDALCQFLNPNEFICFEINIQLNRIRTKSVCCGFLSAGGQRCGPNAPHHVVRVSGRGGCHASGWRPAGAFRFWPMQHVKEYHALNTDSRVFQKPVLSGSADPGDR